MNTHTNDIRTSQGNVLIVAVVLTACLGIMLAGALSLASSQNHSIRRSQLWNLQIPVVEAGIEEAMCHLNNNCYVGDLTPGSKVSQWCNVDGWVTAGYCVFQKQNTLPDGSYYIATIVATNPSSVQIYSEGHALGSSLVMNNPALLFATIGATAPSSSAPVRTVRVDLSSSSLFANGLAAREWIDLNGNQITTDSFDSSNPAYSTQGMYDPAKRRSNGDIATANGLINATWISVGNANIMGHIATAPNGSVTLGPQGVVGDSSWQSANGGVQPGYITHDLNVSFPDVKTPDAGSWNSPATGVVTNVQFITAVITNTSIGYPLGQSPIITNFTTITSPNYPGASASLITTNITVTTTASLPSAGAYAGQIFTNTTTCTTATYPAPGTYLGTPATVTVKHGNQTTTKYQYQSITSYSYNLITSYTYAQIAGYTYYTVSNLTNVAVVTSYTNILDDGFYKVSRLSGTTYVRGNAKLWVTDDLNLSGILIASGASLKLYSGAASVSLGGNGVVNQPGYATNFFFYGLPTCTSVSLSGNAGFTGCIYAPDASLTLNGGGNNRTDFIGAGVFRNAKFNGHFCFHYDEALRKLGPRTGYVINSWQEVPNQSH